MRDRAHVWYGVPTVYICKKAHYIVYYSLSPNRTQNTLSGVDTYVQYHREM